MVNICWFCNHVKYTKDSRYKASYCEVLEKMGKPSNLETTPHGFGVDRSEECGSFAWNCNVEQIIRKLKWLSDCYDELYNAEYKLMVVRQGNTADGLRVLRQSKK